MATTKNITMKQFNGTDYDTLYPKTNVEQVENLTPSSIGAVAKSGDTMTGQLSVPAFALTNYNAALEIGKNIDFHVAGSTNDYDARLAYDSGKLLFRMRGGDYKTMLHTGNLSNLGVARIATGSYTGTGTYGESNPNTLTFGFDPKLVIVWWADIGGLNPGYENWNYSGVIVAGGSKFYPTRDAFDYYTVSGKSVSWYTSSSSIDQLNTTGAEYAYIAIG